MVSQLNHESAGQSIRPTSIASNPATHKKCDWNRADLHEMYVKELKTFSSFPHKRESIPRQTKNARGIQFLAACFAG